MGIEDEMYGRWHGFDGTASAVGPVTMYLYHEQVTRVSFVHRRQVNLMLI
jgi:hypothetical protein